MSHPHSGKQDPVSLGPVRVAGWAKPPDGRQRPLLHSKLLVLGVTTYYEDDEMFADDISRFHPTVTWMGSANWSSASRSRIDHGLWTADVAVVRHNCDYLLGAARVQ